jgi:hypothetical protein
MNESRMVRVWSLVALCATAIVPLAAACGGSANPPPSTATTATATMGMGQPPPPGYPGAPPPGYPGAPAAGYPAAPPPGYATAPPAPQPGYPPPGAPPPATAAAPTGSPPGPLAPTDPNSLQGILSGIQAALPGVFAPGGAVSGDVTDAGLKLFAARAAPGMSPEGDELKQALGEGQHAVMMMTLQAGKCYTIVGFSPPGAVKDLDLNLLTPVMTLAGQDLSHNNTPTIGGAPNPMCPVFPIPIQYKLDVFAKSGSGQVAVQLFSKNKS